MPKRNEGKGPDRQGRVWEINGRIGTLVILMAALTFALVMASGVALAQTKADKPDAGSTQLFVKGRDLRIPAHSYLENTHRPAFLRGAFLEQFRICA